KPKKEKVAVGTVTGKNGSTISTPRRRGESAPDVGSVLARSEPVTKVYPTIDQINSMSIRDFGKYITNIVKSGKKDLIKILEDTIYSSASGVTLPANRLMGKKTIAIAVYLETERYKVFRKEIADAFELLAKNSSRKTGSAVSEVLNSESKMKATLNEFERQVKATVEKGTMSDARYASEQRKAVTKAKKDLLNGVLANWRAHLKSEDNMKKGNATVTAETKAAAMAVAREATGTAIEGDITSGSFAGINLGNPVIDGGTWTFPLTIPEGMKLTGIVKSFKASMSSLLKGGATIQIVGARRATSETEKLGITGSKLVIYNFDSASSDLIKDNPRKALAEIISGSTVEKPEAPAPRGRPKAPVVAEVMAKEVSDDVDMLAEIEEFDAEKEVDELLKDLDSDVPGDGEKALQILNEYKAEKLDEFKDHLDNPKVIAQMKIVDKAIATLDMVLTPDEDAETKVEGDAKTDGEIV
ncbi:MAG: hypothetical protein EB167_09790, partial [Nitrososphaeria archaeon]|nr:hypothetical protein [Nitrososphaeria archaeon]